MTVQFVDEPEVREITRHSRSMLDDLFWEEDELAEFRHHAFLVNLGLEVDSLDSLSIMSEEDGNPDSSKDKLEKVKEHLFSSIPGMPMVVDCEIIKQEDEKQISTEIIGDFRSKDLFSNTQATEIYSPSTRTNETTNTEAEDPLTNLIIALPEDNTQVDNIALLTPPFVEGSMNDLTVSGEDRLVTEALSSLLEGSVNNLAEAAEDHLATEQLYSLVEGSMNDLGVPATEELSPNVEDSMNDLAVPAEDLLETEQLSSSRRNFILDRLQLWDDYDDSSTRSVKVSLSQDHEFDPVNTSSASLPVPGGSNKEKTKNKHELIASSYSTTGLPSSLLTTKNQRSKKSSSKDVTLDLPPDSRRGTKKQIKDTSSNEELISSRHSVIGLVSSDIGEEMMKNHLAPKNALETPCTTTMVPPSDRQVLDQKRKETNSAKVFLAVRSPISLSKRSIREKQLKKSTRDKPAAQIDGSSHSAMAKLCFPSPSSQSIDKAIALSASSEYGASCEPTIRKKKAEKRISDSVLHSPTRIASSLLAIVAIKEGEKMKNKKLAASQASPTQYGLEGPDLLDALISPRATNGKDRIKIKMKRRLTKPIRSISLPSNKSSEDLAKATQMSSNAPQLLASQTTIKMGGKLTGRTRGGITRRHSLSQMEGLTSSSDHFSASLSTVEEGKTSKRNQLGTSSHHGTGESDRRRKVFDSIRDATLSGTTKHTMTSRASRRRTSGTSVHASLPNLDFDL